MTETYGDMYLRFADEAAASEALAGYAGSVDVLGTIEGLDGWFVNTRGCMTETLQAFAVTPAPTTPIRVWA